MVDDALPIFCLLGEVAPSSPAGPEYDADRDERDALLGNDEEVPLEDEGEGEELFGDNYERCVFALVHPASMRAQ